MSRYRAALFELISGESKAYGFTLIVWGTAALTDAVRGTPRTTGVMSFVGGVLVAFVLVVLVTFRRPDAKLERSQPPRYAFGVLHPFSVASALAVGWAVARTVVGTAMAYFAAGGCAVLVYEFVFGLEVALSIERRREPRD